VFFTLPNITRFFLSFALAFLPLSGGFVPREQAGTASTLGMSAPVPLLLDSAKVRASIAGVDRITLYLPSLYTNYLSYSFKASPEKNLSTVFFSRDLLSQWQRWQL
jgi:hypothetical protein